MQAGSRIPRLSGSIAIVALAAAAQLACGTTERKTMGAGSDAAATGASESARLELTGCMERGPIPGSFVLTHASAEEGGAGGATGTTGSSAGEGGAATGAYTVMSGDGGDLGTFVGKRVTVAGRFAVAGDQSGRGTGTSGTMGSPAGAPDAAPGTPGVPGSRGSAPGTVGTGAAGAAADSTAATSGPSVTPTRQFTASDVREVAGSCTTQ